MLLIISQRSNFVTISLYYTTSVEIIVTSGTSTEDLPQITIVRIIKVLAGMAIILYWGDDDFAIAQAVTAIQQSSIDPEMLKSAYDAIQSLIIEWSADN
jgi:hypothetical protein